MSQHYNINKFNIKSLKDKIEDWNGEKIFGIDENGLFVPSAVNRNGIFDLWRAYDVILIKDAFKNNLFIDEYNLI